jgi:hypothetical protein
MSIFLFRHQDKCGGKKLDLYSSDSSYYHFGKVLTSISGFFSTFEGPYLNN